MLVRLPSRTLQTAEILVLLKTLMALSVNLFRVLIVDYM